MSNLRRKHLLLTQPIGIHKLSQYPSQIAIFCGIENPDSFTSHAFRRTAATLLADGGASVLDLKRAGSWLSTTIAEEYIDNSGTSKRTIADIFKFGSTEDEQSSSKKLVVQDCSTVDNVPVYSSIPNSSGSHCYNFSGATNCSVHIVMAPSTSV